MAGLFVTFEGVDGAGKTTQVRLLREALERDGEAVCVTREPGGDPVGEGVRNVVLHGDIDARAELLLFLASRAQNVAHVIRPHLEQGGVVLCDRFIDSSVAYQGWARNLGIDLVRNLNRFATGGLEPDVTFLLDLLPDIGLERQTDHNRMEAEGLAFLAKVREGFLQEAANSPSRFCVLDARQPVDALHRLIIARIRDVYPKGVRP